MSLTTSEMTPADIAAVTRNNNGFGMGGDGAWWIIILFLFMMGGNGYGRSGAMDNYVLGSDFATLQRQLSDGFNGVEKGIDTVRNGLCDGFYTEAQLVNGVNVNMLTGFNGLGSKIDNCCCTTQRAIDGLNYNIASSTCAITSNADANTRAILDKLNAQEVAAKDARIAELTQQVNGLALAQSQCAQNAYLINALRPTPVPAYNVGAPYFMNYGTTLA